MKYEPLAHPLIILLAISLPLVAWAGRSHRPARNSDYERGFRHGVQSALDETLAVGVDMHRARKRPHWIDIQREVSRRLNVNRDEWFMSDNPQPPRK